MNSSSVSGAATSAIFAPDEASEGSVCDLSQFISRAAPGLPVAAIPLSLKISNSSVVSLRGLPSIATLCCFSATLRVIRLRLTEPFRRPVGLPERPFRNRLSAGGGIRPSADVPLFCFCISPRFFLLCQFFNVLAIAFILRPQLIVEFIVPRRQSGDSDNAGG